MFQDARFWLATSLLAGSLLAGAFAIWLARHRRRESNSGPSPNDQLSLFRSLYEKGEISEEEFTRLRGTLGGQIRQSLGVVKPTVNPDPPPEAASPP